MSEVHNVTNSVFTLTPKPAKVGRHKVYTIAKYAKVLQSKGWTCIPPNLGLLARLAIAFRGRA